MTTQQEWREGRRRLQNLLPWARGEASRARSETEHESPLFKSMRPYVREVNFDALLVTPGDRGGWNADLVLKNVPNGVPNVMGTPVAEPFKTRAEAEEAAKRTLVMACGLALTEVPVTPPSFLLYGFAVPLLPELLAAATDELRYGTPFQAATRLELLLDVLCPNGFKIEDYTAWPLETKAKLVSAIHRAALSGLHAFPMRRAAPPKEPES